MPPNVMPFDLTIFDAGNVEALYVDLVRPRYNQLACVPNVILSL